MTRSALFLSTLAFVFCLVACTTPATPVPPEPAPSTATVVVAAPTTPPATTTRVAIVATDVAETPVAETPVAETPVAETPVPTTPEAETLPDRELPIYTRAVSETLVLDTYIHTYVEPYRDETMGVEVRLSPRYNLQADVDGDGDIDKMQVVNFVRATGGEFSEVAYLVNEGDHYTSTQSILIGEQVLPLDIILEGNSLRVELYTHGERDFLCCPTARAEIEYIFDGELWQDTARINIPETDTPLGIGITTENIQFDTSGFATHPIAQLMPGSAHFPPDPTGSWVDVPDRLEFHFGATTTPGGYSQPTLLVFRHDPDSNGGTTDLETWLEAQDTTPYVHPSDLPMPLLGAYPSTLFFATQGTYFPFASGNGARYLALPGMQQAASSYEQVLYAYKGLTSDGQYEILFFYPLSHPDLDTILPLDSIQDIDGENAAALDLVNALAEGDLADTIAMLDAFVTTITIQP